MIDVYRDRTAVSRSFVKVLLYISFFSAADRRSDRQKHHDIEKEIDGRRTTTEEAALGIRRFICGLAKSCWSPTLWDGWRTRCLPCRRGRSACLLLDGRALLYAADLF